MGGSICLLCKECSYSDTRLYQLSLCIYICECTHGCMLKLHQRIREINKSLPSNGIPSTSGSFIQQRFSDLGIL